MKVLVWNAPWAVQGDLLFFKNCYLKHLLLQANLLAKQGFDVDLVVNDFIHDTGAGVDDRVRLINISAAEIVGLTRGVSAPMVSLYKGDNPEFVEKVKAFLAPKISTSYDVILLWENPVPFLEQLFPQALIVHQMPGALSRAPYPITTTFDVQGLYKHGSLYKCSGEIIAGGAPATEMVENLRSKIKDLYSTLPSLLGGIPDLDRFDELALLPLQVSNHYAFQVDTPYATQTDYLLDVMNQEGAGTGVVATQYVTANISDTVLGGEAYKSLCNTWSNLLYDERFDKIANVSQHLLPSVAKVITCSSSVGIQALLWGKELEVFGDTFLKPYATETIRNSGGDVSVACDGLLNFVFEKHQVLSTKIVHDGEFLADLLRALIEKKRAGLHGVASYVEFSDIDPSYAEQVLEAINPQRLVNIFKAVDSSLDAEMQTAAKFERAIKNNDIKTISFDVFDTLIARPVEVPADAYHFLEMEALKISGGALEDFARVRLVAEVETRASSNAGEITLDEIYEYIAAHYQVDLKLIELVKACEIEMEVGFVEQRVLGRRLWNIAKASRCPIFIISDMYLPHDVVERMLRKNGYEGYEKLYVSSTYGVRKKEGQLFDEVIADQSLDPTKNLHVGDNKAADIDMPQERGMLAFRIPRAIDRMRGNAQYKALFNPRSGVGQRSRSVIAGLIAHRFFDMPAGGLEQDSLFMGNSYRMGYAAVGPMLAAYMLWLSKKAKADGVSRLYFLSREGWILKEVYDHLTVGDKSAVPSTYLYCSRRAVRVAALVRSEDIPGVASQPFEAGVTVGHLLSQRFGISIDSRVESVVAESKFASTDYPLTSDAQARIDFSQLCVQLSELILAHAAGERAAYLDYLSSVNIANELKPAVVDIGWKGNMQGALGSLLGRSLSGYYYATLQGVERWSLSGHSVEGFAGNSVSVDHSSAAVANRHLCEFLTCKADGSLVSFSYARDGKLKPNFRIDAGLSSRNVLIQEVHRGVLDFSKDMQRRFGAYLAELVIDPILGERVFKSFLNTPLKPDASLLVGYSFEDSFGGVDKKFVIGRDAKARSVWDRGAAAIYPAPKSTAQIRPTPKAEVAKQPKIGEVRPGRLSGIVGRVVSPIENVFIKFSVSRKKYEKYKRDRHAFFQDSKDKLAIRWYGFTNPEV